MAQLRHRYSTLLKIYSYQLILNYTIAVTDDSCAPSNRMVLIFSLLVLDEIWKEWV